MLRPFLFLIFTSVLTFSSGQNLDLLNNQDSDISFRGIHPVDDNTIWLSGTKGTIKLSQNGGKTFKDISPIGYETKDFRAIYGFDSKTAVAIAIESPGIILKTTDGGKVWKKVYQDENEDVFIDAIDFLEEDLNFGIAVGDPVNKLPYFLKTTDEGNSWKLIPAQQVPDIEEGEAFFAASNSNIILTGKDSFMAVTGGSKSHLLIQNEVSQKIILPYNSSPTSGPNAFDYSYKWEYGIIAGGDFLEPKSPENNLFVFSVDENDKVFIKSPKIAPEGYASGVSIIDEKTIIICGLNGIELSKNKGETWEKISETPFHTCKKSKSGKKVFLAGPEGRTGVIHFD